MVEPNQTVSEMSHEELTAMLKVCYSLYLGIDLEEPILIPLKDKLVEECFLYHGKLYAWKLRELFSYYAQGLLEGMESEKPTVHSLFIYKMKTSYFNNPGRVRQKLLAKSKRRY